MDSQTNQVPLASKRPLTMSGQELISCWPRSWRQLLQMRVLQLLPMRCRISGLPYCPVLLFPRTTGEGSCRIVFLCSARQVQGTQGRHHLSCRSFFAPAPQLRVVGKSDLQPLPKNKKRPDGAIKGGKYPRG